MNIVVIGSCTDSSNLAKELNKRLQHSIVARVDLLKNIKQLLLPEVCATTDTNLGTYIGDVEHFDFSKLSEEEKNKIRLALTSIRSSLLPSSRSISKRTSQVSTFDALTNGFPSGTYSFIKVYSGVITDDLTVKLPPSGDCIFVVVKNPKDLLFHTTTSEDTLKQFKKAAFAFVECNSIDDVFQTEMFQMILELDGDTDKKKPAPPQREEVQSVTTTFTIQDLNEVLTDHPELEMELAA